ncbi:MAG: aminotransferase class I/II-fold pyridoxal phosphate-dependent enzyme [Thermoplasmata archaeon]|nr:DegT/DnrJ/EryC1/StrS family aminotransferase [Thermoplasmata archaeon]NIS14197.1 DegT/DnrJ/EryC1/StrS family aminotransferase [Thermoplasmata archaeon]NIS22035.1 DegT/DnrJ/EryC1/StrS family aminotransferase [Thermoplasmata archaeon]NIT79894.1 DegT/DnrJ/EryC1/StrS family aminotransferase [Thermoplasmata archaeon]NIU51059.1 DegT/DnrJ/EryC1/StrS family aminotransferase [Thermoplasmata archaeon]
MIPISKPLIGPEEKAAVEEVMGSGILAQGPKVAAFEEAFADYIGATHAVAVSSGTEAIRLGLLALGVGPNSEVVVPAFTFVATATAVMMTGATPVIVDVEEDTFCMDPAKVEPAITNKTKAVMPVHLYGHPADMGPLVDLCEERDLALVEDACQAHGARWKGRRVGSVGEVGTFSFYPTKNMTTGEGGAVTTSEPQVAERLRLLRQHGLAGPYQYKMFGYNSRMTDIEAAIGLVQLGKLDGYNMARRMNASILTEGLEDVVATPTEAPWAEHVYHQYTIRTADRGGLWDHLGHNEIGCGVYYPHPLSEVPILEGKARVPEEPVVAKRLSDEVLSLPVHPGLTSQDLELVIMAVRGHLR